MTQELFKFTIFRLRSHGRTFNCTAHSKATNGTIQTFQLILKPTHPVCKSYK